MEKKDLTSEQIRRIKKRRLIKLQKPKCMICQENINDDKIICPICKQIFCISCIKSWLMNIKPTYYCPCCAKKWDNTFICNNLPLGFVVNDLRLDVYGLYTNDYDFDKQNDELNKFEEESDEEKKIREDELINLVVNIIMDNI